MQEYVNAAVMPNLFRQLIRFGKSFAMVAVFINNK